MSIYRNSTIFERMMEIYEEKLTHWGTPYESIYVDTTYGKTHVIVSGSMDKPFLILLPGLAVTAAMWQPNIAAFSQHFRCYAVDVVGDYGKSTFSHAKNHINTGQDYSLWLRQVYSEFGIEKASLVGSSNGGFIAINHALYTQEQVEKIILLAPSGLDVTLKKILPKIFYYLLFPTNNNREKLVSWFIGDNPLSKAAFYEQLWLGIQGRPKVPIPILISGNKLRKLTMSALFMFGEQDPTISARKGVGRVKKYMPHAQTEVFQGVGHVLNVEAAEKVEEIIISFLNAD